MRCFYYENGCKIRNVRVIFMYTITNSTSTYFLSRLLKIITVACETLQKNYFNQYENTVEFAVEAKTR